VIYDAVEGNAIFDIVIALQALPIAGLQTRKSSITRGSGAAKRV
jgi:hypothetical protein